jgi:hypothetical protein
MRPILTLFQFGLGVLFKLGSLEWQFDEVVILPDVDGVIQEDDEEVGIDMYQFVGGEGEVDMFGRLGSLYVDGLFFYLLLLPVQRGGRVAYGPHL